MAISNLVNSNEEYIKGAISDGIDAKAVSSILEDVMNKSDELKSNPKQIKEVVDAIVSMKKDNNNLIDEKYISDFVKKNSGKINSALKEGITPDEIAKTLINSTNKANNKVGKKHLNFIVKLISRMKKKELKLKKEKSNIKSKGYQKVLK